MQMVGFLEVDSQAHAVLLSDPELMSYLLLFLRVYLLYQVLPQIRTPPIVSLHL